MRNGWLYPIVSIEDGMRRMTCGGWKLLTERLGARSSSSAMTVQ